MPRCPAPIVLVAAVAALHTPMPLAAQDPALPAGFVDSMPLYRAGLGPFHREITTRFPEAQRYFDQGIQLLYAFTPRDAARSFREAWRRDPNCAMCYWGEAWAWGPYLNGPMTEDAAPHAYAAIQRALALVDGNTTEVERALIEAMATRYVERHVPEERVRHDSTYANAMRALFERFPADLEAGTLYGEALMLLEPRRGNWDIENPDVQLIHQVLEDVLGRDIEHPGACHLYIHATESTTEPGKAQGCAEYLGTAIPGASHINHMPSHTWNRVGRWSDAVRANQMAWHSDQKAEIGEGFAIYPSHNLHMLLFAASMDGQGAVAIQAGRDYGKLIPGGSFYHMLAMVRFGRFDDALELTEEPEHPIYNGLWRFGRGYALLRTGNRPLAEIYARDVERLAAETPDSVQFRGHDARHLLGVVGGILRAEVLREQDDLDGAITVLEEAVRLEDELRYDEPEPLNFSARHWLGAILLDADRAADAEQVYRAALEDHPFNGWSLFGLEQALRALRRNEEAGAVRRVFEEAWERADVWLTSSRF